MSTGRRPLTKELYETLVIAFRESPGNGAYAARRALCDPRMARRLWDGKPYKDYPWAKSIKALLDAEKLEAQQRAIEANRRAMEAAEADREKARREGEEARNQERQILRVARGDVLQALALAAELVPAMRNVGKSIAKACELQPDGSPPDIAPKLAMDLLQRHALLVQRAVGAAEAVIQLSRTERGADAPVAANAVKEEMTLEEALNELEALPDVMRAGRAGQKDRPLGA